MAEMPKSRPKQCNVRNARLRRAQRVRRWLPDDLPLASIRPVRNGEFLTFRDHWLWTYMMLVHHRIDRPFGQPLKGDVVTAVARSLP